MKVTIIGGAGTVGSCTAFALAQLGLAYEIVSIDINYNLLTAHVMDLNMSLSDQDLVVRAGKHADLVNSNVVIIAAGGPFRPTTDKVTFNENIPIILDYAKKIEKYCPDAIVITATNPVDSLNYAMFLATNINPSKLIGYNLNDSFRFQKAIAQIFGAKRHEVEGLVMGKHHEPLVMLFSSIKVKGHHIAVTDEHKWRIKEAVGESLSSYVRLGTGRTAGWTTAAGLSSIVRAVKEDNNQVFPCSAIIIGEYGYEGLSMGVPVIIGREGIREILLLELSPGEKEELRDVASLLLLQAQWAEDAVEHKRNWHN